MTEEQQSQPIIRRLWSSIARRPLAVHTDQERKWAVVNNFVLHFRPVRVPARALAYTHTFGLGGMSLVLVSLLIATGGLMMFAYEPAPGSAYNSVLALHEETLFGGLIRRVHYWSANLLIVIVALHLLRVFFTGGFHPPRQFNWVIGVTLLLCVVASNFTGYLLPWDQLSYWAITISTGMLTYIPLIGEWLERTVRGGSEIGQPTLTIFYTLHTTVVPTLIVALMAWHFWRVRKAKGVVVPRVPGESIDPRPVKVLGLPFLILREFVVALTLIAAVMLIAALAGAPLGDAANPGMSPNPAKAPWYFMGVQELLLHFHPTFAVMLIPLAGLLALLAIPYIAYDEDTSGIWFASYRGRALAGRAAALAIVAVPLLVILSEWVLDLPGWMPWLPPVISNGALPVAVLGGAVWAGVRWLRIAREATQYEAMQTVFVFAATGFVVLTAIGVWFRGEGMGLGW
jgi:quinol-cytochrome oxidoreductase complex cytochrome b subunit